MSGEKVVVTAADREAYLSLNMLPEFDAIDVRAGRWDHVTGVQAFARHRQSALSDAVEIVRELSERLAALCFADMGKDEDEGAPYTTQEVWETIYRDRVSDWVSFEDLDAARTTLAKLAAPTPTPRIHGTSKTEGE